MICLSCMSEVGYPYLRCPVCGKVVLPNTPVYIPWAESPNKDEEDEEDDIDAEMQERNRT